MWAVVLAVGFAPTASWAHANAVVSLSDNGRLEGEAYLTPDANCDPYPGESHTLVESHAGASGWVVRLPHSGCGLTFVVQSVRPSDAQAPRLTSATRCHFSHLIAWSESGTQSFRVRLFVKGNEDQPVSSGDILAKTDGSGVFPFNRQSSYFTTPASIRFDYISQGTTLASADLFLDLLGSGGDCERVVGV